MYIRVKLAIGKIFQVLAWVHGRGFCEFSEKPACEHTGDPPYPIPILEDKNGFIFDRIRLDACSRQIRLLAMSAGIQSPCAPQTILIAEDDANDVFLLRRAFRKNEIRDDLQVVGNGHEAVAYLLGEGKFADRQKYPFPSLLITDLKMPLMDGLQLLQWMHSQPSCSQIRKVLMSSSELAPDRFAAYESGVCCYYTKPVTPQELMVLVKHIYECRPYKCDESIICGTQW